MQLPCGQCLGCREAKAKEWALRCRLELQEHAGAAFTTLTYDEKNVPPTLNKRDLQLFLKRLRKRYARQSPTRNVRFFACGEYGETTGRPHFHAILFGSSTADAQAIQKAWPHGHTMTVEANIKTINYVAGYTAKKLGDTNKGKEKRVAEGHGKENVDPETGEVYYTWQPPFIQMSRKPGIGGDARDKYQQSWRKCAVNNGKTQAVPRYLHEQWKKNATPMQLEKLKDEKTKLLETIRQTPEQREAAYQIAIKKQELRAAARRKI